jgi:DNA-directed RNA polymerase specialized sigma24 family protein
MTASFATTRWTLVLAAGEGTDRALGELCSLYRAPLLAHARRRGLSSADADDAVQGFLARLLRLDSLATARRERGRFRAFLLGSFNHYLADLRDHARAARRDDRLSSPLDQLTDLPSAESAPDTAFDRAWALALLDTVTVRLRAEHPNPAHFDALLPCLAGRTADTPHADLAIKLNLTEPAIRVALHRLRQRYRHLLREEVAQTVPRPEDIDIELRHLLASLSDSAA